MYSERVRGEVEMAFSFQGKARSTRPRQRPRASTRRARATLCLAKPRVIVLCCLAVAPMPRRIDLFYRICQTTRKRTLLAADSCNTSTSATTQQAHTAPDLLHSLSGKDISPQLLKHPPTQIIVQQRPQQPMPKALIVLFRSAPDRPPRHSELCTTWRRHGLRQLNVGE